MTREEVLVNDVKRVTDNYVEVGKNNIVVFAKTDDEIAELEILFWNFRSEKVDSGDDFIAYKYPLVKTTITIYERI